MSERDKTNWEKITQKTEDAHFRAIEHYGVDENIYRLRIGFLKKVERLMRKFPLEDTETVDETGQIIQKLKYERGILLSDDDLKEKVVVIKKRTKSAEKGEKFKAVSPTSRRERRPYY